MPSLRAARTARRPAFDVLETRVMPDTTPISLPGPPAPLPQPVPPPPGAPPLAVDDPGSYDITSPSSQVNVLSNDLDGNPGATWDYASVTVVTGPANGVLNLDPVSGTLLYTPNYMLPPGLPPGAPPPATPQETFTYYVKDSLGLQSNTATVTLNPNAGAGGGVFIPEPDIGVVRPAESVTIDVLANDALTDGSSFIRSSVGFPPGGGTFVNPAHGSVTFDPLTGKATYTPDFGYLGWDTFAYSVRTTSGLQGGSYVDILINPGPPRLVPDPAGGGQMLVVDGTNAADTISILPGDCWGTVKAVVNGVASPSFRPDTKIEVFGYAGDDTITVSPGVRTPAWLIGGFGNDSLTAGGGPTLLMGSEGNDSLTGGRGRDILIGGAGADSLVGRSGGDLLVGGRTAIDLQPDALARAFGTWSAGGGWGGGRWGWYQPPAPNPFNLSDLIDDGAKDTVVGGGSGDLILGAAGNPPDAVTDPWAPPFSCGRGRGWHRGWW